MQSLTGRGAIITGANRGLGLAIARAYVGAGADVMLCARDADTLQDVREELAKEARPGQQVLAQPADVSIASDVAQLVERAVAALPELRVLVNNAGMYGPKGAIDQVSMRDWQRAIEVNLYGSVFMAAAVAPHLRAKRYGKIIQLSGGGATKPMPNLSAYAASKAAVVRFAETLALELKDDGIDVNSVAPGALNTRMLDEILAAGPQSVGQAYYDQAVAQQAQGGSSLTTAAGLSVFLGSAASDGITGRLISAVWDPWEKLPLHRPALQGSDVYTLRRIVPADRGFDWE